MEKENLQQTDELLMAAIKAGDMHSFSEIYQRYWPLLYRHAFKILKDEESAEDVVQDVYIKFWEMAPQISIEISVERYLYRMVRNQILNMIEKTSVRSSYLQDLGNFMKEGYEITDHLVRERILIKIIEDEIKKLPLRMREVFELKRNNHLSYKEIADVMDISELTVKTQMNKAITILRKRLGNQLSLFLPVF